MAKCLKILHGCLWGTGNDKDNGHTGSVCVPEIPEKDIESPKEEESTTPTNGSASPVTIILGTAHLINTPGKCSPDNKFREYAHSRRLVKEIYDRLVNLGYTCVIDYLNDDMPGLSTSQELRARVSIVNDICKEKGSSNCIYVSVHINAATGGCEWKNATGWSIYTSPGTTKSDALATCIYEAAQEILYPLGKKIRTDFSDGDADYEENFYVLKHTSCPAVLTENFFQDCRSDVAWLESEEGFNAIVEIHVRGIIKYLASLSKIS